MAHQVAIGYTTLESSDSVEPGLSEGQRPLVEKVDHSRPKLDPTFDCRTHFRAQASM